MFEYMIQGIARAGGVELPVGQRILPHRSRVRRGPGIARRSVAALLSRAARSLEAWSRTVAGCRDFAPAFHAAGAQAGPIGCGRASAL